MPKPKEEACGMSVKIKQAKVFTYAAMFVWPETNSAIVATQYYDMNTFPPDTAAQVTHVRTLWEEESVPRARSGT